MNFNLFGNKNKPEDDKPKDEKGRVDFKKWAINKWVDKNVNRDPKSIACFKPECAKVGCPLNHE